MKKEQDLSKEVDKAEKLIQELGIVNDFNPMVMVTAMTFSLVRILNFEKIPEGYTEMVKDAKKMILRILKKELK